MAGTTENERLWSLDALRGLDMMLISGLGLGIQALCLQLGFGDTCLVYRELEHAAWHGINFEDTIFPLFMFISGISFPWSLASQRRKGFSDRRIMLRCLRRAVVLWLLGLMYGGFLNLKFGEFNGWISILSRIGVAWALAALVCVSVTRLRIRLAACAGVLIGYWAIRTLFPAYVSQQGRIDVKLVECLIDVTLPLAGMIAGDFIRRDGLSGGSKALALAVSGAAALGTGLLAHALAGRGTPLWWTAGRPLFMVGYSLLAFALFYWVIDVLKLRAWTLVFRVWGMNSITIYLAQPIFIHATTKYFVGGLAQWMPEYGVQYWIAYLSVATAFLWFLYRKNVFLRV